MIRAMVAARPIALYWQEMVQRRLCAPGGRERKRDRREFEADNGSL